MMRTVSDASTDLQSGIRRGSTSNLNGDDKLPHS
jgi:hypothetical protein